MTFWDHLDELRGVLFRSAIALLIAAIVIFFNKSFVFDTVIFAPTNSDFILYKWFGQLAAFTGIAAMAPEPFSVNLINIELSAQFFTHVSVSLTLAFILTVPYIIYQLWTFVSPGLYEKEKSAIRKAFAFASVLFFVGILVGYLFVFP